ncbi:MAG: hypothetical protein FJ267_03920 [Planctomycetes bacterium]|nr:hypothetical protein [Planctomycetota bacterium]
MASRRTELLIILTPRVVRSHHDNELLKQTEMARMSWCAADVINLHGDIGFYPDSQIEWIDNAAPVVINPDLNPTGETVPAPLPNSSDETQTESSVELMNHTSPTPSPESKPDSKLPTVNQPQSRAKKPRPSNMFKTKSKSRRGLFGGSK